MKRAGHLEAVHTAVSGWHMTGVGKGRESGELKGPEAEPRALAMAETQHPGVFPTGPFSGLEDRALEVGVWVVVSAEALQERRGPVQKVPAPHPPRG